MGQEETALNRIAKVCLDAFLEEQDVDRESLFRAILFFRQHDIPGFRPKITLTPEGKFRAQWPNKHEDGKPIMIQF